MTDEVKKTPTPTDVARETLQNPSSTPEDVWKVIQKAIANLISLEITTEVTGGAEAEKLYTRIDLFQADRINQIHINFLKDLELAPLRDFHAEQVKLAEADIQKKIEFLERMGNAILERIKPSGS